MKLTPPDLPHLMQEFSRKVDKKFILYLRKWYADDPLSFPVAYFHCLCNSLAQADVGIMNHITNNAEMRR